MSRTANTILITGGGTGIGRGPRVGGIFRANAIPHLVSGQMGRPFRGLLISVFGAAHFGRFHGGNNPE